MLTRAQHITKQNKNHVTDYAVYASDTSVKRRAQRKCPTTGAQKAVNRKRGDWEQKNAKHTHTQLSNKHPSIQIQTLI